MADDILLGLAFIAFLFWWRRRAESAEMPPRFSVFGGGNVAGASMSSSVPHVLWTYWDDGQPPLVVQRCLQSWELHNPGYVINVLTAQNLLEFVESAEIPEAFASAWPARQSDWLRLYLLRRYGGIWLDASIFLTAPIDWMIDAQQRDGSDYVGFYLERTTSRQECPIVDSWCMAAPVGSRFVDDWYRELSTRAMVQGDRAYLAALEQRGIRDQMVQKLGDPAYLIIHVAAQVVLHDGSGYRLSLTRAEDSAYFYHMRSRWKRGLLYMRLLLMRHPHTPPALVKLRGGERRKLEGYLRWRFYRDGSLAGVHLAGVPTGEGGTLMAPSLLSPASTAERPTPSPEVGTGRHD